MHPDDHEPTFDPGVFRYAVARYVRLLIRARLTSQPQFLSPKALQSWELDRTHQETHSTACLLEFAADALAYLNSHFIPRCGSGGYRSPSCDTPLGRVITATVLLVRSEGGSPHHNLVLQEAANVVRSGQSLNWDEIADWAALPSIRSDLDLLPHPSPAVSKRLDQLATMVQEMATDHPGREWYAVDEFAELVGKGKFTVREWCRLGRLHAEKQQSGRGRHQAWVISRAELERYRKEGLRGTKS